MHQRRAALRNLLLIGGAASGLWTAIIVRTGGFVEKIGPLRLSSRDPTAPTVIAIVLLAAGLALTTRTERRQALPALWAWCLAQIPTFLRLLRNPPVYLAPIVAGLATALVVALAFRDGAFYAGGSDVYGYVSQVRYWASGALPRIAEPLMEDPRWRYNDLVLTPLGYIPTGDGAIVPIYAPGLPLLMAAFTLVGGDQAAFFVVPILAGLSIWAIYLLGTRFGGPAVGSASAVLLATSPTFLFQAMLPMTDVPVTAWWTLALAMLLLPGRGAALCGGLAASVAILIRPNLAPLGALPGLLLLWHAARERSIGSVSAHRVLLFALGAVPGCLAVAAINAALYGSPLLSGYGPLAQYYRWEFLPRNLTRYPLWLVQTQTPLILLALAAPFLRSRPLRSSETTRQVSLMWGAFVAAAFGMLLCYMVFETWFYLRLALPALAPLIVLSVWVLANVTRRLPPAARTLTCVAAVGWMAWHGTVFALDNGALHFKEGERKNLAIGKFIAANLPENAALISMQQSGSLRYYTGRLTLRYDFLLPRELDGMLENLRRLGYHPFFVLEEWEKAPFTKKFTGRTPLAPLDWPPYAWLSHSTKVFIYDPADRDRAAAGQKIHTLITR